MVPVVVFLVVVAVVLGVYHLAVQRPETASREALEGRLNADRPSKKSKRVTLLRTDQDVSAVPLLDKLIAPFGLVTRPLAVKIDHADLKLTVGALVAVCMIAAVIGYFVSWILLGNHLIALGVAPLIAMVPVWFVRFKASQRINKFEEQFPEVIDLISRALKAGHAFSTALSMAADEAPQPVGGEFKRLYEEQNFGRPLPDAMRDFAGRIPVLDAKFFVTAVLTQRESGGNLSEILDNLAGVIRERFKVKRQIRVLSAHGRMTAGVLISLPPFLALCFMVMSPNHLDTMTSDPLGWLMIGGAVVQQLTGSLIIKKLINIEY